MKILQSLQRRPSPLAFCILLCLLLLFSSSRDQPFVPFSRLWTTSDLAPANATLGFGAIYVVSGPKSPRKEHLLEAAAVSELDFTVPTQPEWTEDDMRAFRAEDSKIQKGSVKAWLSHHLVLKQFLESGQETALILEDDVDWDIRLRTKQVPIAQRAAQSLWSGQDAVSYPWGHPKSWDLLYIGHCGDYFGALSDGVGVGHHHPADLDKIQHVLAPDPTMPWRTDLHPYTASLLTAFRIPEQTRIFHRAQWPLCSFGYVVNRRSAQNIMEKIAPAKEDLERPMTAYDAAILTGCRDGPLVCYTLQPELFHHMEGTSLIDSQHDASHAVARPPVDAAGLEQVKYRGETSNIGCGFWSGDFYPAGDEEQLKFLVSEVGRKGRCLKEKKISE